MSAGAQPLHRGERLLLDSGRVIELLHETVAECWECAYLRDGQVLPQGHGWQNRVRLRVDFLQKHGRPAR